ncbi:MAG: hypothetical protein ACKO6K_10575 [Chitinophagaceae bacterium]
MKEFVSLFPDLNLPVRIADTSLAGFRREENRISPKNFSSALPDSLIRKDYGSKNLPVLYAIGKAREKKKETYLFVLAEAKGRQTVYLSALDKDNNFLSMMPLVKMGFDKNIQSYGLLDTKFQISAYREYLKDGKVKFKRNVYIANSAAQEFTLIVTEPNESTLENLVNPIDTFPQKRPLSGDYSLNAQNLVSIRDGSKPGELLFFIHLEQKGGSCPGELKGIATMVTDRRARYAEPGSPCILEFQFSGRAVSLHEVGGCGAYRGVSCFFEGRYPQKSKPGRRKAKSST